MGDELALIDSGGWRCCNYSVKMSLMTSVENVLNYMRDLRCQLNVALIPVCSYLFI